MMRGMKWLLALTVSVLSLMGCGLDLPSSTDILSSEPADSSSTKASVQNAREVGAGKTIAQVDKSQPKQDYHPEPTPTRTATPTPTPTPEPLLSQQMVENEIIGLVQHELRQVCVLDSIYMTQNLFSIHDELSMWHTGIDSDEKSYTDGVASNEKFYENFMPPRYRADYKGNGIWSVKFILKWDEVYLMKAVTNPLHHTPTGVSVAAGEWEVYEDSQSVFALPNPWMNFLCGGISPKDSLGNSPKVTDSPTMRKTTLPSASRTPAPATR